jgi:hypothetical protein
MEDKFKRVTGFDFVKKPQETKIDKNRFYGLTYAVYNSIHNGTVTWNHYGGSFSHIYGIYKGLLALLGDSDDKNLVTVFYELEGELTTNMLKLNSSPRSIVYHAQLDEELNKEFGDTFSSKEMGCIRRDLTNLEFYLDSMEFEPIDFSENF